ncbi:polycystic kidney disease 2-like 2 protein isoform X5 [Sceloporus undulatus]|uniref:polycystic kidney disease 2-like 2 protein isoform X5 n=1 Tax=Sceloporus undulatus TaxID=8520 RepID=UPI001C4C58BA|nr:polycystic kidney disease 2-like 2 protein isoform X5 [Sceloporus undulatus]
MAPAGDKASMESGLLDRRSSGGNVRPRLTHSRELEMKTTLQELLIYIIFLTDLCILTFGMVSTDMYYLNKVMLNLFLETPLSATDKTDFTTMASITDYWQFLEGPLLDGLFWNSWYNDNSTSLHKNSSHIYYENLLLGVPQIRQLRIRNNTCSIYPSFRAFMKVCYGQYRYTYEDRESFGLKNDSAWHYSTSTTLSPWHWGLIGLYSSGGFMFTLPKSKEKSLDKLLFLREHSWITRGTRVIFIDFSMYNANVNLFCIVRLVVEFPATGGVIPSWQFHSVKLLRYVTYYDYFLASCEVIFCLFIFTFIIQEITKMKKLKKDYFRDAWNWLDILLLLLSVFAIAFNVYRTVEVSRLMENLLSNSDAYPDFYFLGFWQTRYNNMISVNVFFAWIKIFKFISFNKTMTQLSSTLSRCAKDIIGFAIMFFIIFFAYAHFTQFRIVLGDFNFASIEHANRILGPIYFITFVFFVFFVLLNMFLAIINDTYSEVKADFSVIPSRDFEISDLIRQSYNKALVKLKLKRQTSQTEDLYSLKRPFRKGQSASRADVSKAFSRDFSRKTRAQTSTSSGGLDSVSHREFQKLSRYVAEMEKQLKDVTFKLNEIMKSMSR